MTSSRPHILLVSPKHPPENLMWDCASIRKFYGDSQGRSISSPCYPLALPLIAALIKRAQPDISLDVVDEDVTPIPREKKWDLVCISTNTLQVKRAFELCRDFSNTAKVILGGSHFSLYTKITLAEAQGYANSVVFGKTDNMWTGILDDFLNGKLQTAYMSDPNDADDFRNHVIPAFEYLKMDSYLHRLIETSRGCIRRCDFCCVSDKLRFKPIGNVIEEIKILRNIERQHNLQFASIFFADNLLNPTGIHSERSSQLMEALIKYKESHYLGDNLKWSGQADFLIKDDEPLIRLMSKAGARRLLIGFESFHNHFDKGLGLTNPRERKRFFAELIAMLRKHGIEVIASFIIGHDNDPETVFIELSEFIEDTNLTSVQVLVLTPFPGTKVFNELYSQGRLISSDNGHIDWTKFNSLTFVFKTKKLEAKYSEYIKFLRKIYNYERILKRVDAKMNEFPLHVRDEVKKNDLLFGKHCSQIAMTIGGEQYVDDF